MSYYNNTFPRSLVAIGLSPGFNHEQFCHIMEMERSDEIRALAHQEWSSLQGEENDNSPYRWYLSYVSMKAFTKESDTIAMYGHSINCCE